MPAVESEFAAAVDAKRAGHEDAVWEILSSIVREPDAIGFAIARLQDPDPVIRVTACDLVGRAAEVADVEFWPAVVDALLAVSAAASVVSLVWALRRTYDARVLPRLLDFSADPHEAVRLAVASSLPNVLEWGEPEPPEVIDALIVLSRDRTTRYARATLGLGHMTDADGPEVRAALLERAADRQKDAREEGVCGLARRRDPRGIALLRDLLVEESLQVGAFRIAALAGGQSYLPLLEAFDAEDLGVAQDCTPRSIIDVSNRADTSFG